MARKAAAENLYTYNIDKVLQELGGELRVVHTVHQSEVEANLQEWVESLEDEVSAPENMTAIRRRRGQDAKDYLAQAGVTIVPGKGVFTVKPPSNRNQGRSSGAKVALLAAATFSQRMARSSTTQEGQRVMQCAWVWQKLQGERGAYVQGTFAMPSYELRYLRAPSWHSDRRGC